MKSVAALHLLLSLEVLYPFAYVAAADCLIKELRSDDVDGGDSISVDFTNLPSSCDSGDAIKVQDTHGKIRTYQNVKSTRKGEGGEFLPSFSGETNDGSYASLSYVRHLNEELLTGSIVDPEMDEIIEFQPDGEGQMTAILMHSNDFGDEDDEDEGPIHLEYEGADYLFGDLASLHSISFDDVDDDEDVEELDEDSFYLDHEDASDLYEAGTNLRNGPIVKEKKRRELVRGEEKNQELGDDDGVYLDIFVLWTKKAECFHSNEEAGCSLSSTTASNMRASIDEAVADTNMIFDASGVDTQLRLVHSERTFYDEGEDEDNFHRIALDSVKSSRYVNKIRERYGADIVSFIIQRPSGSRKCGRGSIGPRKDLMFSVATPSCIRSMYTFTHEVAHNLGCHHDRGTKKKCADFNHNYGWRDPSARFRTMMAYSCVTGQCDHNPGGKCTRIKRFSTPDRLFDNMTIGDYWNDNVRQINKVKETVAGYYLHKTKEDLTFRTDSILNHPNKSCGPFFLISGIRFQSNDIYNLRCVPNEYANYPSNSTSKTFLNGTFTCPKGYFIEDIECHNQCKHMTIHCNQYLGIEWGSCFWGSWASRNSGSKYSSKKVLVGIEFDDTLGARNYYCAAEGG